MKGKVPLRAKQFHAGQPESFEQGLSIARESIKTTNADPPNSTEQSRCISLCEPDTQNSEVLGMQSQETNPSDAPDDTRASWHSNCVIGFF